MRASGRVPAVIYGHGLDGLAVSVDGRDLRHALSGEAGLNQLLSLSVGSQTHLAMARVIQRHPVRHTVLHVDFQVVRRDEIVSADVPLVVVGEAKAVEQELGLVEQPLQSLTVKATPSDIPSSIEIDVTDLVIGATITVGDLRLPERVTTDVSPDEVIVVGSSTRAAQAAALGEEEGAEAGEAGAGETVSGSGDEGSSAPAEEG
jgi:large subunit ribosomal protein L25